MSNMSLFVLLALCTVWAAPPATITDDANSSVLANGYIRVVFNKNNPQLDTIAADFTGGGSYTNVVAQGTDKYSRKGFVLERENSDGTIYASSQGKGTKLATQILTNTPATVSIRISGIQDTPDDNTFVATETWTLTLNSGERHFTLDISGSLSRNVTNIRSIRHGLYLNSPSIYGLYYNRGTVQMMNFNDGSFGASQTLNRFYSLGNNVAIEMIRNSGGQTVMLSSGSFYHSGYQEVVLGTFKPQDGWTTSYWNQATPVNGQAGFTWSSNSYISPNNHAFPTITALGASNASTQTNLPFEDLAAIITGIYASPVGCLETYDLEKPGQISTTIHTPGTGYSDLYNFFDPDNFFATGGMLISGDPFLIDQSRTILERTGSKMLPTGQIPHHFDSSSGQSVPVYVAISGATQTGPNLFWTLTCLRYVKVSGNLDWLKSNIQMLELSTTFLLSFLDKNYNMLKAPGPLWIDVFIRNNFTSDTNGIIAYMLNEMALAETYLGNTDQASEYSNIATQINTAYSQRLWNTTANDHFITQLNPDGTTTDFVDYDSNLLAVAFNIATDDRASRILTRIDSGDCVYPKGKPTWVSEVYYGTADCYNGNTGDSATAMARIGWADFLSRVRMNQTSNFNGMLNAIRADLLANTWLTERYDCNGNLIRTNYYYEYPTMIAIVLRELRYGIYLELETLDIKPFGVTSYNYHIGNVNVDYNPPNLVKINMPGPDSMMDNMKTISIYGLPANTSYKVVVTAGGSPSCMEGTSTSTTNSNGVLSFVQSVHVDCFISISPS